MNILLLPSWYASEREPNSGIFFAQQAKALIERGNNVTIAVVDIINYPYKTNNKFYKIIKEKQFDMDVIRIEVPSLFTGHLPFAFFKYYTHFYLKLYKELINSGMTFDIIHAHSFWPAGYAGTILKKRYSIPLVITEHRSIVLTNNYPKSANKYLKKSLANSNYFITVSSKLKDVIEKHTQIYKKIKVIPNMVDDIFEFNSIENKSTFDFITVGNLNKGKRIFELVETFISVFKDKKNIRLCVIGDGPEKKRIESFLEKNDLNNQVALLGACSKNKVFECLCKSNVFVLASAAETFGIVYAEAIILGRPVIATHNGGADDIINNENGVLLNVDDFDTLGVEMKDIVINYKKYDLKSISEAGFAKYSKRVIIDKIIQLYLKLD